MYSDAVTVRSVMPAANAFNIPDLMHFPLRSWEACAITRSVLPASIPHIRAIDIPPGDELSVGDAIIAAGLSEVLVIKGDAPSDLSGGRIQTQVKASSAASSGITQSSGSTQRLTHTVRAFGMKWLTSKERPMRARMGFLPNLCSTSASWRFVPSCCAVTASSGVSPRSRRAVAGILGDDESDQVSRRADLICQSPLSTPSSGSLMRQPATAALDPERTLAPDFRNSRGFDEGRPGQRCGMLIETGESRTTINSS